MSATVIDFEAHLLKRQIKEAVIRRRQAKDAALDHVLEEAGMMGLLDGPMGYMGPDPEPAPAPRFRLSLVGDTASKD